MEYFNSYNVIIFLSVIIIISYLFNVFAKKTNIPSVLLLISLGVGLQYLFEYINVGIDKIFPLLEILGIIGLIMIVLEAALDLELTRDKWPIIWKSFGVALLGLLGCIYAIAYILEYFNPDIQRNSAILYAIPLSVLSSAIIIPSTAHLGKIKKEFMIYESTFSDILGIMIFYFFIEAIEISNTLGIIKNISLNLSLTVLISIIVSYILVFVFQNIKTQVKLFLLISVLLLLYSIGKKFHLSSLLIILIFGLKLNNHAFFFRGFLSNTIKKDILTDILKNFKVITAESSFLVRTFFFIVFGISITLSSLYSFTVVTISLTILFAIYFIRHVLLKLFLWKGTFPQIFLAPRGLITILLFFAIPQEHQFEGFDPGILLFIILGSSLIMTFSLLLKEDKEEEIIDQTKIEFTEEIQDEEKSAT